MTASFDHCLQPIAILLHSLLPHLNCHLIKCSRDTLLQLGNVVWTSGVDFGFNEALAKAFDLLDSFICLETSRSTRLESLVSSVAGHRPA